MLKFLHALYSQPLPLSKPLATTNLFSAPVVLFSPLHYNENKVIQCLAFQI